LLHEPNRFVQVFLTCPLAGLKKRDQTGVYQKAIRGNIPHFTGISDPYERPEVSYLL